MSDEHEPNLEELTKKELKGWAKQSPQFISLMEFEAKIIKIIRGYEIDDRIVQDSTSHKHTHIKGVRIGWAIRQKGNEPVISSGTYKDTITHISQATGIPIEQLEVYFKGSGKPYKKYKQKFENEYKL